MSLTYICHYSEIGLKGKNRSVFEKQLMHNIKRALKANGCDALPHLRILDKRVVASFPQHPQADLIENSLSDVFGLVHFARVRKVENDLEAIKEACLAELESLSFDSFAIRTKRANKRFAYTSNDVNVFLGAAVVEKMNKKVNLSAPDVTCFVEVLDHHSFVYARKIAGAGGLPVGSSGKIMALLSGGFDSPVAAYYALKRGATCEFIHFHSFPYTNKKSQEKVRDLAGQLNRYQFKARLHLVPFAETQEDIVLNCPDKLRVVLYRRFMMRLAEKLARRNKARALLTGESLGQVASQTLANMGVVEAVTSLPVLRPLVGLDKNEIIAKAREIGTYDISVLPHDDACTRFMPKHPVIHARLREVEQAEQALDSEAMVERDFRNIETLEL